MRLIVEREPTLLGCTFGLLYLDDALNCVTLEPPIREVAGKPVAAWKVEGHTATPFGTFPVKLLWSPHFKAFMPHVTEVPGFTDTMIHFGDFVQNTEGCTLVGRAKFGLQLVKSIDAFVALWPPIAAAFFRREPITITYRLKEETSPV